jgi:glycerol-3-phosphate acyltransferase PlsY
MASRLVLGRDIRELGNGNMGAKNTFHSVGWLAGVIDEGKNS